MTEHTVNLDCKIKDFRVQAVFFLKLNLSRQPFGIRGVFRTDTNFNHYEKHTYALHISCFYDNWIFTMSDAATLIHYNG